MDLSSLQLGAAFSMVMRTAPLLLIRLGAYLVFWVAMLIYLVVVGGVALLIGQAIEILGFIIFMVAIIGILPLYNLAYRYVFFMIKAAHLAVLSELVAHGSLPDNTGQLAWGRQRVEERFGEINVMFVMDEIVSGVVKAFTRTVYTISNFLPGDLRDFARVINRVIFFAMTYIDEVILARSFWRESENPWVNARDGVVLYAMVWKPMLINAVALMLLSFVPAIIGFVIFAAPIGLLLSIISPQLAGWSLILMLLLAWLIKVAVGDAFAIAAMLLAYHRSTADLKPDPNMTARLDQVSDKFQELRQRAQEAVDDFTRQPAPQPQPDSPESLDTPDQVPDSPEPPDTFDSAPERRPAASRPSAPSEPAVPPAKATPDRSSTSTDDTLDDIEDPFSEGPTVKEQMQQASALIKSRQFEEARQLLRTIDHPKAQEWLQKLEKAPDRQPPQNP